MTFADRIRAARLAAGLTQPAAARLLGVSLATVCNWEKGRTEPPTEPVLTQDGVLARLNNQVSAWPPIETAPKDALILGHDDGMVRLILWESGQWKQVGATIEAGYFMPTCWHPLPPLPE